MNKYNVYHLLCALSDNSEDLHLNLITLHAYKY